MKTFIASLLVLFMTTGCLGFFQDEDAALIQIGSLSSMLSEEFADLETLVEKILEDPLITEKSKIVMRDIMRRGRAVVSTFEDVMNGKHLSDTELYGVYKDAKGLYIEAKPIIEEYYKAKGEDPHALFIVFDRKATRLDKLVTSTEQSYNTNTTAISEIGSFVTSLIRILATAALTVL
jgi:hypothetical protein